MTLKEFHNRSLELARKSIPEIDVIIASAREITGAPPRFDITPFSGIDMVLSCRVFSDGATSPESALAMFQILLDAEVSRRSINQTPGQIELSPEK